MHGPQGMRADFLCHLSLQAFRLLSGTEQPREVCLCGM